MFLYVRFSTILQIRTANKKLKLFDLFWEKISEFSQKIQMKVDTMQKQMYKIIYIKRTLL